MMARLRGHIDDAKGAVQDQAKSSVISLPRSLKTRRATAPHFAPGGQSTQMIVGADAANDRLILSASASLYSSYKMRRVYYSAFSPIPDASKHLPLVQPPLMREHRLYQADWLMRFYGFAASEIVPDSSGDTSGMLSLDIDPKLAWALAHREQFPVNINTAAREMLLRIPGLGVQSVQRILQARRVRLVRLDDLLRMHLPLKKVMPFVLLPDHHPGATLDAHSLAAQLSPPPVQAGLFDEPEQAVPAPTKSAPLTTPPPEPLHATSGQSFKEQRDEERSFVWA